jgi:aspartyl-tRNA(Asn)/glutamyl-tRNA(Gln) amidotransferase subunit B
MAEYVTTIGLEIHAELKTRTGMFCSCLNDPNETRPNINVCPVCLGHPGALPTINKKAVEHVIRTGLALGGNIAPVSKFDRKNYFYPDLPKGYQISQYDQPLATGGELCGVRVTRIHLEEDTGTLVHDDSQGEHSLADFNRAGVPLMELVTEPDIHDAETAVKFAKELQMIMRYLGVSDANMEKGQMRVEVNLSIAPAGAKELGTKVEVKNINSFKAVEGAILYEVKRHKEVLDAGKEIVQETRGWDDIKRVTVSQRSKENAHDYRYFPEPDLPPFETSSFDLEELKRGLPELPRDRRIRFKNEYGLSDAQADALVEDRQAGDFYETAASELKLREEDDKEGSVGVAEAKRLLFNYLTTDLRSLMSAAGAGFDALKITPENFAELIDLVADKQITSRQAKDLLQEMYINGGDPSSIMADKGVALVSDEGALVETVKKIIGEQAKAVADYKAGKEASLQFLVGQAMKALKGQGEPNMLMELFKREIGS